MFEKQKLKAGKYPKTEHKLFPLYTLVATFVFEKRKLKVGKYPINIAVWSLGNKVSANQCIDWFLMDWYRSLHSFLIDHRERERETERDR